MQRLLCGMLAILCLYAVTGAADEVEPVANAAIFTQSPDLNDPGTNQGWCNFGRPAGSEIGGMMLFQFDLSSYAGKLVDGDGAIQLNCYYHHTQPYSYGSFPVLSNWTEMTVTWSNFIGPVTGSAYNAVLAEQMGTVTVDASGNWQWLVSNSVIQSWIDTPGDNRGVAVRPLGIYANDCWRSRQRAIPAQRPRLIFTLQNLNVPPRMPTNQTPVNGVIGLARPVPLTASAFSDPDGNGHGASQWQVSRNEAFTSAGLGDGWESGTTAADLTNVTVPATALMDNDRYWWRVRYQDNNPDGAKWSDWSAPTRFDTQLNVFGSVTRKAMQFAMIDPSEPDRVANQSTTNQFVLGPVYTNVAPAGFIMMQFDLAALSEYAGLVVDVDGLLAAITAWVDINFPTTFRVHPLLAAWQQSNVTWNSYIGGNWSSWTNTIGQELDFQVLDVSAMTAQWSSIDKDVIQGWLTAPQSNFGLALVPDASGNMSWRVAPVPTLTFDLINTNASTPDQPVNITPLNGAKDQTLTPMLQASAFSGGASGHAASQWQVSGEPTFQTIFWDSGARTGDLIQITVPSSVLNNSSRYYWRVRYINQESGLSPWSNPTYFDTVVIYGTYTKLGAMDALIRYTDQASNENGTTRTYYHPYGASNGVKPIVLFWFDLGVFEGLDAVGDAQFKVQYDFVDVNFGDQGFTCYRLLKGWQESNVTWETYLGLGETNLALVLGGSFGEQLAVNNESSVWTIAQATVQDWLDSADTNFGLGLYSTLGSGNVFLRSRQFASRAPTLTLQVIPEPAVAFAVFALLVAARRAKL
jgi:hypothetical protein